MFSPTLLIKLGFDTAAAVAALNKVDQQVVMTTASMQKMVSGFSGEALIQKANNIVGAIEQIGGVSTLTAAQQTRINGTVDAAIEKYELLGKEAPAAMLALRDATEKAEAPTAALHQSFGMLTAAFSGGTLLAQATTGVLEFAKSIPAAAGHLVDMSDKTGVSIEYLQQLRMAADVSGSSIDELSQAVFKMGANIGEGMPKTVAGLDELARASGDTSLAFQNIRSLAPEEEFQKIVAAIGQMSDVNAANAIGVEIFGKSFSNLAAAVHNGSLQMSADIAASSAESVRAIKEEEDAWVRLKTRMENSATSALGTVALQIERMHAANAMADAMVKRDPGLGYDKALPAAQAAVDAMIGRTGEAATLINSYANATTHAKIVTEDFAAELRAAQKAAAGVSAATLTQISAQLKLGTSSKDLESTYHLLPGELELIKERLTDQAKAGQQSADAIKAWGDEYSHAAETAKAQALDKWFTSVGGSVKATAAQTTFYTASLEDLLKKGAHLSEDQAIWISMWGDFTIGTGKANESLKQITGGAGLWGEEARKAFMAPLEPLMQLDAALDVFNTKALNLSTQPLDKMFPGASAGAKAMIEFNKSLLPPDPKFDKNMQLIIGDFRDLASVTNGAISEVASDLAKGATAIKGFKDSADQLDKGGVMNDIAGVTGIIGAVVSIGSTIASVLGIGQTAGRDLVTQFAAAQGGFPELHKQLAGLGADGDGLWKSLTQGVGSNNPEQAQAVIDQVTTRLNDQKAALDSLATSTDVWSSAQQHALELALQTGDATGQAIAAIKQQADSAQTGLATALGVTSTAYGAKATDLGVINDPTAAADAVAAATKDLATQQAIIDATQIKTQSQASAVADSIIGIVAANEFAGQSFVEAFKAAGPAVESLQAQLKATGFAGGAAFSFLDDEVRLASGAVSGPALTAVEGYTQAVKGLANMGMLTQDSFAGLESQIATTRDTLVAQGATGQEALAALQPDLQTAWELEQKYGFKVDDATQALIDQGVQAGIVGEKNKAPMDQLITILGDVDATLKQIGRSLTGHGGLADQAAQAAHDMQDAFDGVTGPTIDLSFKGGVGGGDSNNPGNTPVADIPLSTVSRSGLVWVRAGYDVVGGAPNGGPASPATIGSAVAPGGSGGGVSVQFGDVYISGVSTDNPKAFADAFIAHVSGSGAAATALVNGAVKPILRQQGLI